MILRERVLNKARHGAGLDRQVVTQHALVGQVPLDHGLTCKRHPCAGEIVGLGQWVGDKTRLGATGAMAKTKHDDRQVIVTDKPCDPIVDHRHGEQCRGTFFRLHTAGRNKANDRQALLCTFHQQLAEPCAVGVVDTACLEGHVGNHQANLVTASFCLEVADTGDQTMGANIFVQRRFNRRPESWE